MTIRIQFSLSDMTHKFNTDSGNLNRKMRKSKIFFGNAQCENI